MNEMFTSGRGDLNARPPAPNEKTKAHTRATPLDREALAEVDYIRESRM